jgi:hypothetical protein
MTPPDEAAPVWQPQFLQAEPSAATEAEPEEAPPGTPETPEPLEVPRTQPTVTLGRAGLAGQVPSASCSQCLPW